MKTSHEVKQAITAGLDAEAMRALARMKRDLERCLHWAEIGCAREAAAFNIDGGNIVAHAMQLRQQPDVRAAMDTLGFPDDVQLDELARLHATASAHAAAVSAWRKAAVCSASPSARLECLRMLRRLEPRQAIWVDAVEAIEQGVVHEWAPRVQACIASGDMAEIQACRDDFDAINAGGSGGRALLGELDDALALGARDQAQQDMAVLDKQLYLAWLAMDDTAAKPLLGQIRTLSSDAGIASTMQPYLAAMTAWQDRQEVARKRRIEQGQHVERLAQWLDEDRPISEIEPLYAELRAQDVHITPMLESRVSHRYAIARRQHRRRFVLGFTAILVMATLAVVAISLSLRSARYQQTIDGVMAGIQADLDAGNSDAALLAWDQAIESGFAQAPGLMAMQGRMEQLRTQRVDDATQCGQWITQATQLIAGDGSDIPKLDEATSLLDQAASLRIAEHAAALQDARAQLQTQRRAAFEQARRVALEVLSKARLRLQEPAPGGGRSLDPQAWADWMLLDDVDSMLEEARRSPVAGEPDIDQAMERLAEAQRARLERGQARVESLNTADSLLRQLSQTPSNEQAWVRVWQQLADHHLDVLADTGPVQQWHRGRRAAEAALAVGHWRTVVRPAIEATLDSPDAESMSRLARVAATAVRTHLERYDGTPYTSVAIDLVPMLTALGSSSFATTSEALIGKTHLLQLARMPILRGGWIYVRPPEGTRSIRVIDDFEALSVPADLLAPDPIDASLGAMGQLQQVPLSAAFQAWIEQPAAATPRQAAVAAVALVEQVAAAQEPDVLLRLYATRQAWAIALETLRPIAPEAIGPVDQWLNDLPTIAPLAAQADWPALASAATSPAQRRLRTQSAMALAQAPDMQTVRDAVLAALQAREEAMQSHYPAGVLIPRGDRMEAFWPAGSSPEALWVLTADTTGRWTLTPLALDASQTIPLGAFDLPETPAVLFSR